MLIAAAGCGCLVLLAGVWLLMMWLGGDDGPPGGWLLAMVVGVILSLLMAGAVGLFTSESTYQPHPGYQNPYAP
ncbi:hypothetical protein [Actinoplanes sp. RD1]|uniref:hypothetical protein n=1 Tax=Actinoplanes sp. RD1 TaxID=3064538 RepID=UPI002740F289|nr:hypothetical protein [Actinoplanes sp. RD1]